MLHARVAIPTVGLLLAATVTGCGGSSAKPTADAAADTPSTVATTSAPAPTTSTQPAAAASGAAEAAIKDHWEAFFLTATPAGTKLSYLQDAAHLQSALAIGAKSNGKKLESAKVTNVSVTSPTEATVTYDLTLDGKVVLPNATGTAVLTGSVWQISKDTFCGLIQLAVGGAAVPGC